MLTIVFGAGASYDSNAAHPPQTNTSSARRPPLASDLFEQHEINLEVLRAIPTAGNLMPHLTATARSGPTTVEDELAKLEQSAASPMRHSELLALRFFVRHSIAEVARQWRNACGGATNYRYLMSELHHSQAQTSNYEAP